MPTREEMLAHLKSNAAKPTRAQMLAHLKGGGKEPEVIDEMHPDITWADRTLYKNLGGDPAQGVDYFKEKYPDMTFDIDAKGGILARKKDERNWKKIDPSTTEFSDVTDSLYDIGAGIAETGASALGGIAGAIGGTAVAPVAGTIAGGLAGGATAGAATGAGLEALRQKMGGMVGVRGDEMDMGQVGMAGAFGAASPLLLGTGAAGKQVVKGAGKLLSANMRETAKKGLLANAVKKAAPGTMIDAQEEYLKGIAKAQRGVIGHSYTGIKNKVMPKIGQMASGIEADTLKWAAKDLAKGGSSKIRLAEDENGLSTSIEELKNLMEAKHNAHKDAVATSYGNTLDQLDVRVDAVKAELPLQKLLEKYRSRAEEVAPGFEDAMKRADDPGPQLLDQFGRGLTEEATGAAAEKEALKAIEVQNYLHLKKVIGEYSKAGKNEGILVGRQTQDQINLLNDLGRVRRAPQQGRDEIDRELQNAAQKAAGNIDKQMGRTAKGAAFKLAKKQYRHVIQREKKLQKYFGKEDAVDAAARTESTLNNLFSSKANVRRREVLGVASELGVNVGETARETIGAGLFSKPSLDLQSLGGSTSTTRSVPLTLLGGGLGYGIASQMGDEGHGTGVAGAMLGTALGGKLGSAAAMRRYMQMSQGASKAAGKIQNLGPGYIPAVPQTGANVYRNMLNNKRDQ